MYKTVILPLDGSPFAELAVGTAIDIARRSAAQLVLSRVHEAYVYEDMDYLIAAEQSRRDQQEYLAEIAARIDVEHGVTAERLLLDGPIASAICDLAEELDDPLIVVSTHGLTGFSRLWLGSVADAIARHSPTPVLMLRHRNREPMADASPHLFKRILVPLDGSDLSETALPHAVALARAYGARLTLIRIVTPSVVPAPLFAVPYAIPPQPFEDTEGFRVDAATNYLEAISERLRRDDANLLVRTDVHVADSVGPAIVAATGAHDSDTVVMATHGRGASRLVTASVADKVLRGGPEAVLLVRSSES